MPQAVDSIASALEQLSHQMQDLERRVAALEGRQEEPVLPEPSAESVALQRPREPATWRGFPPVEAPSGVIPILGKAVLGIAGAYLLRAISEAAYIPKLLVIFVAILYAYGWMLAAVRIHRSSRLASAAYGVTSALILSPLLWESTVRFHVLSPPLAATALAGFVVLTIVLARAGKLQVLPWISALIAVSTALALIMATRELLPLTTALLVAAFATEVAICRGQPLSMRALPALAADFSLWLLVDIMTSSEVPEGYARTNPHTILFLSLVLLVIYGGSIAVRGFLWRQLISWFDIIQGLLAFGLGSFGVFRAGQSLAAPLLGGFLLLLAGTCYWGTLSRFSEEIYRRNRRVSATVAAALFLAGTLILLPGNVQLLFMCLAATATAFVYTRTGKLSLGLHSSVYLGMVAITSALLRFVSDALGGTVPTRTDWRVWTVGISATLCYVVGSRHREDWAKRRLLWLVPAVLMGFTAAALVVVAVTSVAARQIELGASALSMIRTLVNCALALVSGFLGFKLKRPELGWMAYAAVAFGAAKLLFEDLRFGNALSLVISLLFYGLVLILLPRLTRVQGVTEPEAEMRPSLE